MRDQVRESSYPPVVRAAIYAWIHAKTARPSSYSGRVRWETLYSSVEEDLAAGRVDALVAEFKVMATEAEADARRRREQRRLGAAERLWERQAVEIDADRPRRRRELEGKDVWLWHGTSSELLPEIRRRGLLAEPPKKTHGSSTSGYVYLTTTPGGGLQSGGDALFYARSAAGKHGGDPVILRAVVPWDDLEPDADDEELSCGIRQFRTDSDVPPEAIREIGEERIGWPEKWPKYRNPNGQNWLILVHVGSLDSYADFVQSKDLARDLSEAMSSAARDHKGPVIVVDNPDLGGSIYDGFKKELARVRPDAVIVRFDEDQQNWAPFLRRLAKQIKASGDPRRIEVGGIWWQDDLESGCASEVYRHLRDAFGESVMAAPDYEILGSEDSDDDVEWNPPRHALVLVNTRDGLGVLVIDPVALEGLVSSGSFWNKTCPAGLGFAVVDNGQVRRHVAREGWVKPLLHAARSVAVGEFLALKNELQAGEAVVESVAGQLGVSAEEVAGVLLDDAEAWAEWSAGATVMANPDERVWAYHVTIKEFLPGIADKWLQPQWHEHVPDEPVIFVEPDEDGAGIYHEPGTNTVMLRFKTNGFGCTEDGESVLYDAVPPKEIWVRRGKKWVALLDDTKT